MFSRLPKELLARNGPLPESGPGLPPAAVQVVPCGACEFSTTLERGLGHFADHDAGPGQNLSRG
jgi:hypothetical protein